MALVLYVFLGIVLLICFLNFISPKKYFVKSEVIIQRSQVDVFDFLSVLGNQSQWTFWEKNQENIQSGIIGIDGEVGAIRYWENAISVGRGEQKILNIDKPSRIDTEVVFPDFSSLKCYLYYDVKYVKPHVSKVEAGFIANLGFPSNIFMFIRGSRKRAQLAYEKGMINLKEILEERTA